MGPRSATSLLGLTVLVFGLAASRPGPDEPWSQATRFASNGDGYLIAMLHDPAPIPENEEFTLSVWVLDPSDPDRLPRHTSGPHPPHRCRSVPDGPRSSSGGPRRVR